MFLISVEAFSDVLQGEAQKLRRMDIAGLSFIIRGILLIAAFIVLYLLSGLVPAVLGSAVATLLVVWLFEARRINKLEQFKISFNRSDLFKLLKTCFPLMLVSLLYISFLSVARLTLENATDTETLGIFNSATLPAMIIIQLSGFIFVPLINLLSRIFQEEKYRQFNGVFSVTIVVILIIIAGGVAVTAIIGADLLRLLFGEEIVPYRYLLTEAFVVAGFASVLSFLITVLVVLRKLKSILAGCAVGCLCCVLVSHWLLCAYGISGANYMQMLGMGVSIVVLLTAYIVYMARLKVLKS
jgi:O-antigen/teichoic acid export membrane protein